MSTTERDRTRNKVANALSAKERTYTHTRFILPAKYPIKNGVIVAARAQRVPISPRSTNVAPKDWANTGMKYTFIPTPREATNTVM
jgi:hypothetical protein